MQLPSLVVGLLYAVAFAAIEAATSYFVTGEGASYIFAAVVVAVLGAVGRWLQEQQKINSTPQVTTSDGTVMRSKVNTQPVEVKNPLNEAIYG